MWHDWVHLEVVCEFASFARVHRVQIEEAIDRVVATGHDLSGVVLPWSSRPDFSRRAHAVRVLDDYHNRKKPKRRVCECGLEYEVPIRRGHVPRLCQKCAAESLTGPKSVRIHPA